MSSHDPDFMALGLDLLFIGFCYDPSSRMVCSIAPCMDLHQSPIPISSTTFRISFLFSFHHFLSIQLSHLALATSFDGTYPYVLVRHLRSLPRVIPNHISTRYTLMYNYSTILYTLLQYLFFYGTTPRAEYLCTHSKNHLRSSGSTPGVMPCPRFAIHPFGGLAPARNAAHMRRTLFSISSRPPYSLAGSRFPCSTLFGAAVRASSGTMHQSRPSTS
jgi:hypothetical protein